MGRIQYFSTVFAELGGMLEYISPLTAVPLLVAVAFREYSLILPMAAVPVVLFLLGFLLNLLPRREKYIRLSSAFCSVALVWLAFALVSTIPFMLVLDLSLTDALFETMAGWTGTGFSLLDPSLYIPETLLFWRTFMQWIGGMGVIALSITMASRGGLIQSPLFHSDSRSEQILPGVIATGKELWAVYIFLTIIGAGVILVAGIPLYEAINLSLTTISTGGYLPFEGGLAVYNSHLLEYLLIPVMIVGSTPFTLYYISYRKRKLSLIGNEQVKLLLLFLAVGTLVVVADLYYLTSLPHCRCVPAWPVCHGCRDQHDRIPGPEPPAFSERHYRIPHPADVYRRFIGKQCRGVKLSRIAIGYRGIIWWLKGSLSGPKSLFPSSMREGRYPTALPNPSCPRICLSSSCRCSRYLWHRWLSSSFTLSLSR